MSPDAGSTGDSARTLEGVQRRPARIGWTVAAVGVVGAFVAFGLITDAVAPGPQGPPSSSYATTPAGVAAWAELLQRAGHPVRALRQALGDAALDPSSTVVVIGADRLSSSEAMRLQAFVRAGGRLVIGGGTPARTLPVLLPHPPRFTDRGAVLARPLASTPETDGLTAVTTAGEGAWLGGSGQAVLGSQTGALLVVNRTGRGRIDLLADPSAVQNRLLATADNAKLALDLAGEDRRPVVFAEALHGYGAATGVAALPAKFWLAFVGLCLAGGMWALARGRRLGPPEQPGEAGMPARAAYVEAMSAVLSRTHDPAGVAQLARAAVERELKRHFRGGQSPSREALLALGLSAEEADAVASPPRAGDDAPDAPRLLALGRALARLRAGA